MGASDSKLVFKQGVFKAQQQHNIPADDIYWTGFWTLPESVDDVFSLFSPTDIRRIRDESLGNLETLILAVTSRLLSLRSHDAFPLAEVAPARELLNCVRVLTRLLPFVYEEESLTAWEERFFWSSRRIRTRKGKSSNSGVLFDKSTAGGPANFDDGEEEAYHEARPLAEELIDTLVDLLFFSDFTVPRVSGKAGRVNLAIWQSGVGCASTIDTSKELESNRMEILRLLLTLASKSMYTSANILPVQGVRTLTYMSTNPHKQKVLTLLCSLLNTTLKYDPTTWNLPYDHVLFKDPRQVFVTYCLQFLLVLILYPVPESEDGIPPQNTFRHFLGKIHRPGDFQILLDGMTRVLNQPLQATTSYLPGSQRSITWAPEMIMLFWEVLQCNKRFRSFIIDADRMNDFTVLILFYALQNKNDPAQQGIVRMCVFVLQTLSIEPSFGPRLNKSFHAQDALPQNVRIPEFVGSYMDYLIISLHALMTSGNGKLDAVYPALLAILNNLAPHATDLSSATSMKLMQILAIMSSTDFLFLSESNHSLLQLLLEAFNAIIEYQYEKNAHFIFAVLRSQKRFYATRDLMVDGAQEQLDRHVRARKDRNDGQQQTSSSRRASGDGLRSSTNVQGPPLSNVPENDDAFAIGDDDESEDGERVKPESERSPSISEDPSRAASIVSSNDDAVPAQVHSMSEKARGKLRAGHTSFSRQGSSASLNNLAMMVPMTNVSFEPTEAWVDSWLPDLPLQTTLTLIEQLSPLLPPQRSSSTSGPALTVIRQTRVEGLEPSPMRIHLFEWSPLSLGWYESLLWGFIFASEATMFKGATGIWKGTHVRLFRVQEAAAQGPSLMAPKGAVDAVGSSLVQRIGSLNLRGNSSGTSRNSAGGVIRDV